VSADEGTVLLYTLRRLLWIVPVLLVASIVTFWLMHAAPGSPWLREGRQLDPGLVASLNERFALDQPVPIQYLKWLTGVISGDFGTSFASGTVRPTQSPFQVHTADVSQLIGQAFLPSFQLGLMAFALALVSGVGLGVVAAWNHNRWPDHLATAVSLIGMIGPPFLVAILIRLVFDTHSIRDEGILPTSGWDTPRHWVLPTLALAGLPMAMIARFTRASMLEVLGEPYVRTAHSKGLAPRRVALVHVLRNALIPVVAILGPVLAVLITGSIVIEQVFEIPGVGSLYLLAITSRDYGVIMSMTLIYTVAIAGLNLVIDLLYGVIDPRVRELEAVA
jgi:ABC-type dipeptide/oligopeptide/nickel transport system permease component